ncbi:hypothetical protein Tco_1152744 [Tanacetum coccineum]
MASHRSKSLYAIKECSTCGSLYTKDCCSIKRDLNDKILVPEPDSSPRCARCGTPVDGPSCRGCAFLRRNSFKNCLAYLRKSEFKDFKILPNHPMNNNQHGECSSSRAMRCQSRPRMIIFPLAITTDYTDLGAPIIPKHGMSKLDTIPARNVESGVITRRINLIDDIAIDVASSRDKRARCFTYKNVPESKYVATSLTVGGGRCVWMRAEAIRA